MQRVSLWLKRLALLPLGLALGLGGAELAVRIAGGDPLELIEQFQRSDAARDDCLRPAPGLGYELVPGACQANSLGFHDDEPMEPRPPGGKLVVALGDSLTEQRAYVDMLEPMLTQRLGVPVEVRNMGVSGYSILNEAALLEQRALDFEPDLVLLQVCLNDYGISPVLFRHEGEFRWLRAATGNMGLLELWLFERSALARMLILGGVSYHMRGVGDEDHMADVDAALARMVRLCEQRGIPFELVIFPTVAPESSWSPTETLTYQRLLAQAELHELSVTDLSPRMLAGDIEMLRRCHGDEVYADLDARLAAWGIAPDVAELIRSLDRGHLGVGKPVRPDQLVDTTHPNFLGHYLAAEALVDKLAAKLK